MAITGERMVPRVATVMVATVAMVCALVAQPVAAQDDSSAVGGESGGRRSLDILAHSPLVVPPDIVGSRSADSISVDIDSFNTVAITVRRVGAIRLRAGADSVQARSAGESGYGLNVEGTLQLGSGRDELIGQGTFTGFQAVGVIHAGSGDDSLAGTGDSSAFTHNANGIEVAGGRVLGGGGNDRIIGEARTVTPGNVATGIAIYPVGAPIGEAVLNAGAGNDHITAVGVSEDGFGYGFRLSPGAGVRATGGGGNDVFEGYGTTTGFNGGRVSGGSGHDWFRARIIDGSPDRAEIGVAGAVADVTLFGGPGCDLFDVGYGQATIDGGPGRDVIVLPGAAKDYVITGDGTRRDVSRDGYLLQVRSVEHIAFGDSYSPGPGCGTGKDTASIRGTVTSTAGSPVEDVTVDYFTANTDGSRNRFIGDEHTATDGSFRRTVEPGCYVLVLIAPDGASFIDGGRYLEKHLCVKADDAASIKAVLAIEGSQCTIQGQVVTTPLTQQECDGLVSLFTATGGPNWADNTGWNTATDPCTWAGVGCGDGKLHALLLADNLLTGSIPPQVGQLTNLRTLDISDGRLTGPIPSELGLLSSLERLELGSREPGGNQLSGPIPTELGQLAKLKYLDLTINRLSGPIPPELGRLNNIVTLNVASNQLSGPIPPELGQLGTVTNLNLASNQLTEVPPELGRLPAVQVLELSNNLLTTVPPELGRLPEVTELGLALNRITVIPEELGQLTTLTRLSLFDNQLNTVPASLGRLTALQQLDLRNNQLTSLPGELGDLQALVTLQLSGNQLMSIPAEFGQLANLEVLRLGENRLTSLPPEIGQLSNLDELSVFRNRLTSLPPEIEQMQNLSFLNAFSNQLSTLPAELSQLQNLRSARLTNNLLSGDITAAMTGLQLFNVELGDGPGGNNCLTVTEQILADTLTALDPTWDECEP